MPTFTYIPARYILSFCDLQGMSPAEIAIIDSLPPYRVAVWPNRKGVVTYPTERADILARLEKSKVQIKAAI